MRSLPFPINGLHRLLCLFILPIPLLIAQDLNLARRYEAAGELALAKAIYQAYLTEHPFNPSVYQSYYRVCFGLGSYQEFLSLSLALLNNNPQSLELLGAIGEAYLKLGKKKLGLDYLKQAFALNPEYVGRIGAILKQEKLYKDAIRFILDYRRTKSQPTGYEILLIDLYEADEDYLKATHEIVQLLNTNPALLPNYESKLTFYLTKTNPANIFNELTNLTNQMLKGKIRSRLYLAQKRYREAVAEIKSLNLTSELVNFAQLCEEKEQYQLAQELYKELGSYSDEARVLRKMGKVAEAIEVLKQASSAEAQLELAELYRLELKDFRQAKAIYQSLISRRPTDSAYYGLVSALISLGELPEAKKYLSKMNKVTDRVLFFLTQIYFYEANFDSCQKSIAELNQKFPFSPLGNDALEIGVLLAEGGENLVLYAQAAFYRALGKYEEGIKITKQLINQADKLAPYSFLLLAELYRAKNEPNFALSALHELKSKFPSSHLLPKAKYEQARIYFADLKDEVRYQQTLEELVIEFPNSVYSALARNLLAKLTKATPIH